MAIKLTYKIRQALAIIKQSPRFKDTTIDMKTMMNAELVDLMQAAGYSWQRADMVWTLSRRRQLALARKASGMPSSREKGGRAQIRFMGEISQLRALVRDFHEVADLIGLKVIAVSDIKPMREGGTWGRVYITAEVR